MRQVGHLLELQSQNIEFMGRFTLTLIGFHGTQTFSTFSEALLYRISRNFVQRFSRTYCVTDSTMERLRIHIRRPADSVKEPKRNTYAV